MIDSDSDGILAVWNDCADGRASIYEQWYQHEHLPERLAIDGFIRGRRYQAIQAQREFFTYYETRNPQVLTSVAYRDRLNAPSALTTEIMSGTFINMSRTVCRCVLRHGRLRGAFALTATLARPDDLPDISGLADLLDLPAMARMEVWQAHGTNDQASTEEKLRGGDERIGACLFAETLRAADLDPLLERVRALSPSAHFSTYQLLCELQPQPAGHAD